MAPLMTHLNSQYVQALLAEGIPLEAIITEMLLSGEVERTMRLVREIGYTGQFGFHSPTSQYGQLSRREAFADLDVTPKIKELLDDITSGRFADEWDAERDSGYPVLERLKEQHVGPAIADMERDLRSKLGEGSLPS